METAIGEFAGDGFGAKDWVSGGRQLKVIHVFETDHSDCAGNIRSLPNWSILDSAPTWLASIPWEDHDNKSAPSLRRVVRGARDMSKGCKVTARKVDGSGQLR